MSVKFADFSKAEWKTVGEIASRYIRLCDKWAQTAYRAGTRLDIEMDIAATHASNPLDLHKLLSFDDNNFMHDMCGIRENLNRETGKLENCFSPRCSVH